MPRDMRIQLSNPTHVPRTIPCTTDGRAGSVVCQVARQTSQYAGDANNRGSTDAGSTVGRTGPEQPVATSSSGSGHGRLQVRSAPTPVHHSSLYNVAVLSSDNRHSHFDQPWFFKFDACSSPACVVEVAPSYLGTLCRCISAPTVPTYVPSHCLPSHCPPLPLKA